MEKSEDTIVRKIMVLFHELAEEKGLMKNDGNLLWFDFVVSGRKYWCKMEGEVIYDVPNGNMLTHKSDIMIVNADRAIEPRILNPDNKFVSIEVKHKSSVTDQFKSRSYDMFHMRSTYPKCLGVMMYIREKNITADQAKKICYPFHHFFSCRTTDLSIEKITPLYNDIISFLAA